MPALPASHVVPPFYHHPLVPRDHLSRFGIGLPVFSEIVEETRDVYALSRQIGIQVLAMAVDARRKRTQIRDLDWQSRQCRCS